MEWISVEDSAIDYDKINLFCQGDSIFIKGTTLQPFFMQLCGEIRKPMDIKPTHFMPLPKSPM